MKGIRAVWLAAAVIILINTGCGQKEPPPFEQPQYDWEESTGETLVVWGPDVDLERIYIQNAFKRYEELTGGSLKMVPVPLEEYEEKLLAAFRGETEKPDILLSYGGTNIDVFRPDENFYDFTQAPWVEDLTDTSINQTVYNGKIIGLPHWEASISGTIYNKKIFKKYHLEIPKTQEEFMEVCETLLSNGVIPMYMPCKEVTMLLYQFPLDSVVEDSEILEKLNNQGLGYADIPQMYTIVDWYRTMAQKGYLGEDYRANDWMGMNEAMKSERYAMMMCWDTWLYTDFRGDALDFGLMPAFVGVPEQGTFEGPNLCLFIVNKNSPRLKEALNFITFAADPYNYNTVFEGIYTAPVFKNQVASISTPQYLEAERMIERNFRDSTAWLRIKGFSQTDASAILEYMDSETQVTAEECLKKMDAMRNERMRR